MEDVRMQAEQSPRYRVFLKAALAFAAYNVLGMVIGLAAALPASSGSQGNVHDMSHQEIAGNGTALSPPLFLLVIVVLAVIAATRNGWIRRIGAFVIWFYAGFYLSAAQIGELTTSTSPLTGAKWELVLVLGSIGLVIAAAVLLAGLWTFAGAVRSRTPRSLQTEGDPANR
jgi:hypothetical protein